MSWSWICGFGARAARIRAADDLDPLLPTGGLFELAGYLPLENKERKAEKVFFL
jgi:hypothetical protein